jgi:hypothetical protein
MALLKPTQQARLFSIVQQMGFSLDEFELIQRGSQIDPNRQVHELRHKATGFHFAFEYMRLKRPRGAIANCVTYSPSSHSLDSVWILANDPDVGFLQIGDWLGALKLEIEELAKGNVTLPQVPRRNEDPSRPALSPNTAEHSETRAHAKVFISYSYDSKAHADAVHLLAEDLRQRGVAVNIDRYELHPPQGWPQWMLQQVEGSNFVLCVCTAKYKERFENQTPSEEGKGARFEGSVITQAIYRNASQNAKFIPVLLDGGSSDNIPAVLDSVTRYELPKDFIKLYCRLTGQDYFHKSELGSLQEIAPLRPRLSSNVSATEEVVNREAPRFIVSYRHAGGDWERLRFLNEGKRTAINVRVTNLVHEENSARTVHRLAMIPDAIPTVPINATEEGRLMAEESPGHGSSLRGILRKGTPESKDTMTITFEDGERTKFEQSFELTRQTDDSIRFDPGRVRLQEMKAKPTQSNSIGPILSFKGIDNVELNRYGLEVLYILAVDNTQRDVDCTARNARARVEYTHANNVDRFTVDPVGWIIDEHRSNFGVHVDLSSGERAKIIIAIRTSDGPRVTNFTEASVNEGRKLGFGRWDVIAHVSADNCAPITIRVWFRIDKDGTLKDFHTTQD